MNFKDYIQGKRHGNEANQLERNAMNDPFLLDAIDGFDSVPGDHLPVIEALENKIKQKSNRNSINYRIWIFSAAASLIFLLGIGTLLKMYNLPENKLAQQTVTSENLIEKRAKESQKSISVEPEVIEKKKIIAQNNHHETPKTLENENLEIKEVTIINDQVSSLSVAEIEVSPIEMDKIVDKETTEPTPIKIRGTNSIQNVIADKVSGVVIDEAGQPLIGVSVKYKNTSIGTVTDNNGRFELVAPISENEHLVASYIGFEKKEIPVTYDSAVIQLKPDNLALNEVVVIGYGNKKNKSTAYSSVNVEDALEGRTAGIEISRKSDIESFGEYEFKKYFEEKRNQNICENETNSITAKFYVDLTGKPTKINIINCTCKELENEFIRLINRSPLWTKVNRNVYITIRLKE